MSALAKGAAGAVGVGAGGTFSGLLFYKLNVPELLSQGSFYGITVFAFIAVIVIFSGYITLHNVPNTFFNHVMVGILLLFSAVAVTGVIVEITAKPVQIRANLTPDLAYLNHRFGLSGDNALVAKIEDHNGHSWDLQYLKDVSFQVDNGQEITLNMDPLARLTDVLQRKADRAALSAQCAVGACDLTPAHADDVGG